jgi:predicted O-linked N-acetylglucosamine transferase (SPINDLY family)
MHIGKGRRRSGNAGPAASFALSSRITAEKSFKLGLEHSANGNWAKAVPAFEQACRSFGLDAIYWINLAQAYRKVERHEDSVQAAKRALKIDGDMAIAKRLVAEGLRAQHRFGDSIELLRDVVQVENTAEARFNLADSLLKTGRKAEAVQELLGALALQPDYIPGHQQLGNLFASMGLFRESMECFLTAFILDPSDGASLSASMDAALQACEWNRFSEHAETLSKLVQGDSSKLPVPFCFLAMPSTRQEQLKVARSYAQTNYAAAQRLPPVAPYEPGRDQRPRVGYISNDLRRHPVATNIVEVFELHDPNAVEVLVYSYGPDDNSTLRNRIRDATGPRFVDARHMSNHDLALRIRADRIELLIDLTGHTKDHRCGVLAMRPAPVQAAYLGFPGTSGTDFIDYLICDEQIAPLSHADGYSEKLAHLPVTYQPNDRRRGLLPPPSRSECRLPQDAFVFCCMNNTYKITPQVFDVWCRLLSRLDGSVLWLLNANAQAKENLRKHAGARGIASSRIVFAPPMAAEGHLARMRNADLFLDTLPYNAHTTAGDALWAGVPLITCRGETFASRVAASLLNAVGLPELVAESLEDYEATAYRLATNAAELNALRARLRVNRDDCALFDSAAATRNLEHLYTRMIMRWRSGQPPQHLAAAAAPAATDEAIVA